MKKSIGIGIIAILLHAYTFGSTQENSVTILDKGVKRLITLPGMSKKQKQSIAHATHNDTLSGVLVAFKDTSLLSVPEFETRYGLALKTKMAIGYYVFENHSSKSDIEIIRDIIANEKNVKTVKPNWRLRNTIR